MYNSFASVYDTFMDETPYEKWCNNLCSFLEEFGSSENIDDENLSEERNTVLELGCGTGTMSILLNKRGFDVIGIDNSEEMLSIAMQKTAESDAEVLYLHQDMREFELYGTVGAVFCICDSINYLTDSKDVVKTFKLVNNYLYPGGIFVFDFNTDYKYHKIIGNITIAENREDCSFIWENYYDEATRINEYDLTLFIEDESGLFERDYEEHYQRGYSLDEMKEFVAEAGMEFLGALDSDTLSEVTPQSERIYVIAREKGKK